ncbi:conserved hypothetical protein [Ricinus communis]|uniref:Uncharacterized protein n=1 Tax=Ricinus communis TaxID=3988 RepID=B9S5N1_RICCO|nr:conserved hypothetical protein [Ricinus communis]
MNGQLHISKESHPEQVHPKAPAYWSTSLSEKEESSLRALGLQITILQLPLVLDKAAT